MARSILLSLLFLSGLVAAPAIAKDGPATRNSSGEHKAIFDGNSLSGWLGNEDFWRVEDGAIVAESTPENPCRSNEFLRWTLGQVDDFDLQLRVRISGSDAANSGIQFRSQVEPDGHVVGYQADLDRSLRFAGMLYDEHGRGVLCPAGETRIIDESSGRVPPNAAVASEAARAAFKLDDWNDYRIVARGNHIQLFLNGTKSVDLIDRNSKHQDFQGVLALQLHSGPPMKVEFKDIQLKRLPLEHAKKVVFLGGKPSHGFGKHEFNAGSKLLADALATGIEGAQVSVYTNGWPQDPTWLDNADCLVTGSNGQGGHPLLKGVDTVQAAIDRGMGLVCWHYAVEATPETYEQFRSWLGGGFEVNYSVNPHWTASFDELPEHPITRGVSSFSANDEWYYHMRFVPEMAGVTPILTDMPPRESLSRPDGHHSNNPYVREAVLENKEPQHVAWAYERPDGGRSFGFTGGHNHANWAIDGFRTVVLNAAAWASGLDVPSLGVPSSTPTQEDLLANIDPGQKGSHKPVARPEAASDAKPVASTDVVTKVTPGRFAELKAPIAGAKKLTLVVTDAGNGFACDWADFIDPVLRGDGTTLSLTELDWVRADADFGRVHVNKNVRGQALTVAGQSYENGIGTHAFSAIEFKLPKGHKYQTFTSRCALDDGGASQGGCGDDASVQFHAFVDTPAQLALAAVKAEPDESSETDIRAPGSAVASLDVGEGLEASLFASEPLMYSPSNIDVDHLGRIWVCEVVNYRRFRNTDWPERVEGDRILVLEDTDDDGVADKKTTFYQGRDIDSPHGVCVLGNRVIVSAGEHVFNFYDDDGDLKADRKEVMFSGIDGVQHDHGIHAFVFGPDGKLYFNFGNAGKRLKDKEGNIVIDKRGNPIDQDQGPYQEGMVFRCDLDGSNVETLGWNFRNNWELAVDSFGSLWQSDNDDDGNRGTRINYVLEYGNYGYRDEITKAGWREPRTGMHEEIPKRHWHLNDPGVVPNVMQTGAGSPTGIMVYEGHVLPERFRNEMIHCDAGPNQVRAFPVTQEGAGYVATLDPVLTGTRDQWFRPSDVCAAPDGSLIVADWYDPGVGGHRMQDVNRGRLFRVAVPDKSWAVPVYDFSSVKGSLEALRSPNLEARYLAFTTLRSIGEPAVSSLVEMTEDSDPRMAARALYLLAAVDGHGAEAVRRALDNDEAMLRVVGLRIARQLGLRVADIASRLASDESPIVRREVCVALAELSTKVAAPIWAKVAQGFDGEDRWMLEALGIAARGRWDACLDSLRSEAMLPVLFEKGAAAEHRKLAKLEPDAWRRLVWRSRGKQTPEMLAEVIRDARTPAGELPALMRAFDFQDGSSSKNEVLAALAFGDDLADPQATTFVRAEAIARLKEFSLDSRPEYAAKIDGIVDDAMGTEQFVALVDQFSLANRGDQLLELALKAEETQLAVDALSLVADYDRFDLQVVRDAIREQKIALRLIELARVGSIVKMTPHLIVLLDDSGQSLDVRRRAAAAMTRNGWGAQELAKRSESGELDPSVRSAVVAEFQLTRYGGKLGKTVAEQFPPPAGKDARPIPPIRDLVKASGDVAKGRVVFNTNGTCAKCHVVNGIGKEVGPALDEIGSKLSREAMFVAVLYPSAGVSHNYETFTAVTIDGEVVTGLLVSETDDEVTLKTADGLVRKIAREDVDLFEKQEVSLMPSDLQKVMTNQELIDLVDYMQTLKKKAS